MFIPSLISNPPARDIATNYRMVRGTSTSLLRTLLQGKIRLSILCLLCLLPDAAFFFRDDNILRGLGLTPAMVLRSSFLPKKTAWNA
jgi:hypothetical protein